MKRDHIPIRTCRGCLRRRPKCDLVRLSGGPGGVAIGGHSGRGTYVCRDTACLERAFRRKDVSSLLGVKPGCEEIERLKQLLLGENNLDGAYSKRVICHDRSGGGAVG